jgi:hypothetical protein
VGRRRPIASVLLLAALAAGGAAARNERIVILYENRSGNPDAIDLVSSSVGGVLARKGYEVIDGAEVVDFQEATHLARADPLPPDIPGRLLLRFHADMLLGVVINFVLPAKPRALGPRANPAVGITARLVMPDGTLRWRNSMGVLADDAPLSKGRDDRASAIQTPIMTCSERLLYTLPKAKRGIAEDRIEEGPKPSRAAERGGPKFLLKAPVRNEKVKNKPATPRSDAVRQ